MKRNKVLLFIPMYNCEKQIVRVLKQMDKKVCNYVFKPIINNNTIGMRYSSNEVSSKIKQKLIGCEPWFSNRIMEKIMEQKESDNKIKGNKKSKLNSDAQLIDCVDSSNKEIEN